jgi:hypothetical protein
MNMMNRIGKGLVLAHVAISIVALAWAAGLFLQFTDWGWKEPRSELGLRVPSEYDKRTAAFRDAVKARDMAVSGLRPAWLALYRAEELFPKNHLFYKEELARLRGSPDPIKPTGKAELDDKAQGIEKSYDSYLADLRKVNEEIDAEVKRIREWTDKSEEVALLLSAKGTGIYALLDGEKKAQDQALFEKEYLQPIWARALQEAELFRGRRQGLQETLDGLRGGKRK